MKGKDSRVKAYPSVSRPYPVSIDHNISLEELLRYGNYDFGNDLFKNSRFILDRLEKEHNGRKEKRDSDFVRIRLIHFNCVQHEEDLFEQIKNMGFRPADVRALLSFGEIYPHVQLRFEIVALGSTTLFNEEVESSVRPMLYVPILQKNVIMGAKPNERSVDIAWIRACAQTETCRYAVIEK